MNRSRALACVMAALCPWSVMSCDGPSEAPRVELPVVVDASGVVPLTTDLGYDVEFTSARVALEGLVFTTAGEAHAASFWRTVHDVVVPSAVAHPGHFQGGEVTGELPGSFVAEWPTDAGRELGKATLIAGTYSGSNFTFGRGADGLDADDPLVGHTAVISGTATRGGTTTSFTVVVDSPEGRELVGAPFDAEIGADADGTLYLAFRPVDTFEGDTLFDAIDFAALDIDADGVVTIEPGVPEVEDAYVLFRRTFQTHDHYVVSYEEEAR